MKKMILLGVLSILSVRLQASKMLSADEQVQALYTTKIAPPHKKSISEDPERELVRVLVACLCEVEVDSFGNAAQYGDCVGSLSSLAKTLEGKWLQRIKKEIDFDLKKDISSFYNLSPLSRWRLLDKVRKTILQDEKVVSLDDLFSIYDYHIENKKYISRIKEALEEHNKSYQEERLENNNNNNIVERVDDGYLWIGFKKTWVQGMLSWAGFQSQGTASVEGEEALPITDGSSANSLIVGFGSWLGSETQKETEVALLEGTDGSNDNNQIELLPE